jgi:hypothetical protein
MHGHVHAHRRTASIHVGNAVMNGGGDASIHGHREVTVGEGADGGGELVAGGGGCFI